MRGVEYNGDEKLTLLGLVLRLEGEFRERLAPLRVTPLQAGVILFLRGHAQANMTEAAAALRVSPPTLSAVLENLVRKRWVTRRYSVEDRRAVCLSLSRRGEAFARRIISSIRDVRMELN